MDKVWIVVALVACVFAWAYLRRKPASKQPAARPGSAAKARPAATSAGERFRWPALGGFNFEVVGESHYKPTFKRLAGEHGSENAAADCVATLMPQDDNAYDKSAIQVSVDGEVVGYLSRDDARSFRRRLGSKGLTGQSTLCDAKVVGGRTTRGGEKLSYGIQLDLKPFEN